MADENWTDEERAAFKKSGRMGGATTRGRYGRAHYAAMGRKGGARTKEIHGADHYRIIGGKGGRAKAGNDEKSTEE